MLPLIQRLQQKKTSCTTILIVLVTLVLANPVSARDYKIELLVFKNLTESRANEPHNYSPPQAMKSNAETWFIEPTMLLEQAEAIKNARDYELLYHYSWAQESLPYSQSASYRVAESLLNGWIRVYATQLLFTNIDLDFNGYRLRETRRLKLNERHFFDHPKFGLLLQVSRLENPEVNARLGSSDDGLLPSR